jgi:UDP-N-acetylmuramate dehydrogenase
MMTILENYSLKKHNTFGIEVKTKNFVEMENEDDLVDFLKTKPGLKKNLFIIGGGSNLLFTKDYDGTILKYSGKGIEVIEKSSENVFVKASAGVVWDDLVKYCVENNFYGIENLSLIPGTVGAAPVQNIGAYGVELKDVFDSLEGYDIETCEKVNYKKDECRFGYRDSIFKNELKGKIVVTSVVFKLGIEKTFYLSYRALKDCFKPEELDDLTLEKVNDTIRKIRLSKLPDTEVYGNAGSFFKNPEITYKEYLHLEEEYSDLVFHKIGENCYKIPAGWLIEKCGFKGKKIGNVGTYKHQALVIINFGNANGEEVWKFSEKIQKDVFKKFKIEIHPEVNII